VHLLTQGVTGERLCW